LMDRNPAGRLPRGVTLLRTVEHRAVVGCVVFDPLGDSLVTGSDDGKVKLWDGRTGVFVRTLDDSAMVRCLAVDPQTRMLATGSPVGLIRLWDCRNGALLHVLEAHENSVDCAVFDPQTGTLASGGSDRTVKLWDPKGQHCFARLKRTTQRFCV
jgi:WD40 repeat protein